MDIWSNLALGFSVALTPTNLALAFTGAFLGTMIGALPGIGSTSGVALLLPLTFGMEPTSAIIMLAGIYYGAMYGGTITSVLINTPGDPATIVTTLDGHRMAQQGRAGVALGIAAIASFIAGTGGAAALMVLAPALAGLALTFGPPEYFALTLLGIAMLTSLGGGSPLKAAMSALVGLLLATVGVDVMTGSPRFTFGTLELLGGFHFLPISIGVFGFAEILLGTDEAEQIRRTRVRGVTVSEVFPSRADWRQSRGAIARGSIIGFVMGTLPGAGATLSSFAAYLLEKKLSRTPERFGTGTIEGVAAPEAANNGASAGSMVPLLTLGLPGGTTTAVLVGAFIMWGLRPGPMLFEESPRFVWGLIASMYIGNVMLVLINIFLIPLFVRMLRIPYEVLTAVILTLCMVGAFAANNRMWDVGVVVLFGIIGYLMKKLDYSPAALVTALVLGPLTETSMRQSLQISGGDWTIFLTRPIAAVLMIGVAVALVLPALRFVRTFSSAE